MLLAALSPFLRGDNRTLVAEKARELEEINRQILAQIKDLKQYNNRKVYVKVKIMDLGGGKIKAVIEKISVDRIDITAADPAVRMVYLKGKVEKLSDDSKFTLDLERVLPEEENGGITAGKSKTEGEKK